MVWLADFSTSPTPAALYQPNTAMSLAGDEKTKILDPRVAQECPTPQGKKAFLSFVYCVNSIIPGLYQVGLPKSNPFNLR